MELVAFEWRRLQRAAFEWTWVSGGDDRAWVLHGDEDEAYRPLVSETVLFRRFAQLDGSRHAFEEFAKKFGRLGLYRAHEREMEADLHPHWEQLEEDESYWRAEHHLLAFAVRLWQALQEERLSEVAASHVQMERSREGLRARFSNSRAVPSEARALTIDDVRARNEEDAVRKLLALLVSGALVKREVAPALVVLPSGVSPLRLTYRIETLIAAMWLQLALAINGDRTYDKCPVCGEEWDTTEARSDKRTCSGACRRALNRREKSEQAEGVSSSD